MLRFDLPLTEVKFVRGWQETRNWTTWRHTEQCVLVGRDRSGFSLIQSLVGHFYKVIYLSVWQTANTDKFMFDCVQFWFFALIFASRRSAIERAQSQMPHIFNFWRRIDLKRDWNLEARLPSEKQHGRSRKQQRSVLLFWWISLYGFAGFGSRLNQKTVSEHLGLCTGVRR